MQRPITIITGQFGDLSLEEVCRLMSSIGYDGLELSCHFHIDARRILEDDAYFAHVNDTLKKYDLKCWALSAHQCGKCVGDTWDKPLNNFAPAELADRPKAIREWAIEQMKLIGRAAEKMGVRILTGFLGSPIWRYWYASPPIFPNTLEDGYRELKELWTPIFDELDRCGVKFALEVHPTEIAYDYYTTRKLFEIFDNRPTLGINLDPSHLVWQGVNPCTLIRDFPNRIYHVHMKDVKLTMDGRSGILASHLPFGDLRRGWDFVSVGHGNVDFDGMIRELNCINYCGPLSLEWEDSGMERVFGATEAYDFVKKINFAPSDTSCF